MDILCWSVKPFLNDDRHWRNSFELIFPNRKKRGTHVSHYTHLFSMLYIKSFFFRTITHFLVQLLSLLLYRSQCCVLVELTELWSVSILFVRHNQNHACCQAEKKLTHTNSHANKTIHIHWYINTTRGA